MDDSNDHSQSRLDSDATRWVVRLTSGHATARDRDEARAWIEQDAAHRAAFERARALWQLSGALEAAPVPRRAPAFPYRAAAAIAALAFGLYLALPSHWNADYRTGTGEVRTVTLNDRSTMVLDAESAVDVGFRRDRRRVELLAGEVLFDVQSDPQRPFEVRGLGVRATARGTQYSVRRDGSRVDVVVVEGSVAVAGRHASLLLKPGQRARFDGGELLAVDPLVDVESLLAWRNGRLVFEQTPLVEVVAALNHHYHGHIAITDPALEQLPVSGVFQLKQLDEALDTLTQALPVQRMNLTSQLVLLY